MQASSRWGLRYCAICGVCGGNARSHLLNGLLAQGQGQISRVPPFTPVPSVPDATSLDKSIIQGTRGGCGVGRGPGACPRARYVIRCGHHETLTNYAATRTSTRPPHPPNRTPCPYSYGGQSRSKCHRLVE